MAATEQDTIQDYMREMGLRARRASKAMAAAEAGCKHAALLAIAGEIENAPAAIGEANDRDLETGRERGLDAALLDRLELTPERIQTMADGVRQVAALPDPVGEISNMSYRPSGIEVGQMRVPLGVVGIIYESRPNVTADAAVLCIMSGNAALLRGGSEAMHSNQAIAECIRKGLESTGLPADAVQVLQTTDREAVREMARLSEYLDVLVPRGGKSLIRFLDEVATVPRIEHLDGVCHVYLHDECDSDKATAIAVNAKTHRFGVCNAMETLLVARSRADELLPELAGRFREAGVELRGCERTRKILTGANTAQESDWAEEYLGPTLAVRVVDTLEDAMAHIDRYGSGHTDAIVTENLTVARRFLREVDSSSVMVNASTRFADGQEYGLGAEIGISTDKLHARGPVGLQGLTSLKYVVIGDGQTR